MARVIRVFFAHPHRSQDIAVGVDFPVDGTVVGQSITQVTVQLDSEIPVDATFVPLQTTHVSWAFSTTLRLDISGNHRITVRAIDIVGDSGSASLPVTGSVEVTPLPCSPNIPWLNYPRTQSLPPFPQVGSITPYSWCTAHSLADIVAIVRQAEAENRRVHAVGSMWSFSDCAFTTDYVINTEDLYNPIHTLKQAVRSGSPPLFHVEAGIKIRDLYSLLDANGLALETMGGDSGQSLAGAISTGTHGGDYDTPPIADSVLAIHLVGGGGTQYWIEPSAGITDPQRLKQFVVPDIDPVNIIYDDATFDACLVSLGCMGVIYAIVLRVREAYDIFETTEATTWQDVVQGVPSLLHTKSRFLQVLLDPYTNKENNNLCLVTSRWEIMPPDTTKMQPRPSGPVDTAVALYLLLNMDPFALAKLWAHGVFDGSGLSTEQKLAKLVQGVLTLAPGERHVLVDLYGIALRYKWPAGPMASFRSASFAVMDTRYNQALPALQPGYSVELFFPAVNADGSLGSGVADFMNAFITLVNAATDTFLTGYVAVRFMGRTRASLGMQQWAPTCSVEVAVVQGVQGELDLMTSILELGYQHGGLAHWGQLIDLQRPWGGISTISPANYAANGAVTVVARNPDHLDVFWIGWDGAVWSTWWDAASNWGGTFPISPADAAAGAVTVVARNPDHLDVFWIGQDGAVRTTWWDAALGWGGTSIISRVNNAAAGAVTVVARNPNHLDVFWIGMDSAVWTTWWDAASGWGDSFAISPPGASTGAVAAIARNPDHLDVFWIGWDRALWTTWWDAASGWSVTSTISAANSATGAVTVVARNPDHLDVFWIGMDRAVWTTWWDAASSWGDTSTISSPNAAAGAVAAIARNPDHLDVFWIGCDSAVWTTWWDAASGWGDTFPISPVNNAAAGAVTVVARNPDHLDVFWIGWNRKVWTTWWDASLAAAQHDGTMYPRYQEWRQVYSKLSNNFTVRTFENPLSIRWKLTTP